MTDRRVALLRGVNVGAANRVAMADLRAVFEDLGFGDVRTLLNSGNVGFTVRRGLSRDLAPRLEKAIADRLKVRSRVVVLTRKALLAAVEANPLSRVASDPSRLLVVAFHEGKALTQVKPLLEEGWAPEALALGSEVAYLWCARGVAKSRVWTAVSRAAGNLCTARNMATMTKLLSLLDGDEQRGNVKRPLKSFRPRDQEP